MRRSNTEEFIFKAKEIHGNKYDYSLVEYNGNREKIKIICPEIDHGIFEQRPIHHLRGFGCSKCSGNYHCDTDYFIEKAKKVHGNDYDYSLVEYKNSSSKIKIICHEINHGIFSQTPSDHLSGYGCPKCGGNLPLTTEIFIQMAIEIHGEKYGYSFVKYKKRKEKVNIFCYKENHGIFEQTPNNHLYGQGCPRCVSTYPLNNDTFIEAAKKVHGEKYDYSEVEYKYSHEKIKIICLVINHGAFEQTPANHLQGQDCPKCMKNYPLTTDIFIERAKNIHGDKYDYSLVEYITSSSKIKIICPNPTHGVFEQIPHDHLYGAGCQKCSHILSRAEIAWLNSLGIPDDIEHRQVKLHGIGRKSVDGFDPNTNTAYEFHGDFWHGNLNKFAADEINKTVNKTFGQLNQETIEKENLIKSLGYNLVVMWESDWKKVLNNV